MPDFIEADLNNLLTLAMQNGWKAENAAAKLLKTYDGNAAFKAAFITNGPKVLAAIAAAAPGADMVEALASHFLTACGDSAELKSDFISGSLDALPVIGFQKYWVADTLASFLFKACGQDPTLKAVFIAAGLQALPAFAAHNSLWDSLIFGRHIIEACAENAALKAQTFKNTLHIISDGQVMLPAAFIQHGLDALPVIATQNGRGANKLVASLLYICGDDAALKEKIIVGGLKALPVVAAKYGFDAQSLAFRLYDACRNHAALQATFIGRGADVLPAVAAHCGWAASNFVRYLAFAAGVEVAEFANKAGRIPDGTGIVFSAIRGQENLLSFAIKSPAKTEIQFVADFFQGTADELLNDPRNKYGKGTASDQYFRDFIGTAQSLLDPAKEQPLLSEIMLGLRVAASEPAPV